MYLYLYIHIYVYRLDIATGTLYKISMLLGLTLSTYACTYVCMCVCVSIHARRMYARTYVCTCVGLRCLGIVSTRCETLHLPATQLTSSTVHHDV